MAPFFVRAMLHRVDMICKKAYSLGVKIMIDAEWTAVGGEVWPTGSLKWSRGELILNFAYG